MHNVCGPVLLWVSVQPVHTSNVWRVQRQSRRQSKRVVWKETPWPACSALPLADVAGGCPRHCWQHPNGAALEAPAWSLALAPSSRVGSWTGAGRCELSGGAWCSAKLSRWVDVHWEQPLAAAGAADVNMPNRIMLRLVMALAQAVIAFSRTAALQNSPTPLVFRSGSFNRRSPAVTRMYWRCLIYILAEKLNSARGFSQELELVCTIILLERSPAQLKNYHGSTTSPTRQPGRDYTVLERKKSLGVWVQAVPNWLASLPEKSPGHV